MHRVSLVIILVIFTAGIVTAQDQVSKVSKVRTGKLWVGALVGPGTLIEKADDRLHPGKKDYFNKLRSGWNYGFETEYFFNDYVGIGANYATFNTKQEADSIVIDFFQSFFISIYQVT